MQSKLTPARWAELALSHLRDQMDFAEKRDKLSRGRTASATHEADEEKPGQGQSKARAPQARPGSLRLIAVSDEHSTEHVPGSSAPSFSLPGSWPSLPSLLRRGPGAFVKFFRHLLSAGTTPALTSSTWPCPVPYPETFSGAVRGKRVWKRKHVNLIVALLSWLHLGSPSECPDDLGLGAMLSTSQRRAVRAIEAYVEDRTTSFKFDAELMGRASVKAEDHDKILGALSRAQALLKARLAIFEHGSLLCSWAG